MLEEMVADYASYLKLDMSNSFQPVQDVIDNMLTRLEELTSVLQMIKLKNTDCSAAVFDDISKYRSEISLLSKKIMTLNVVIEKLQNNVDILEKEVEKAEGDFGINSDNRIKNLLKPFLKRNKEATILNNVQTMMPSNLQLSSVMNNFESTS